MGKKWFLVSGRYGDKKTGIPPMYHHTATAKAGRVNPRRISRRDMLRQMTKEATSTDYQRRELVKAIVEGFKRQHVPRFVNQIIENQHRAQQRNH